jgi:hypothetical protein
VKKIINCSKEGPGYFPRGDNHRNANIGWGHLKISFLRTTEPEEHIYLLESINHGPRGWEGPQYRVKQIYICFNGKFFFSRNP